MLKAELHIHIDKDPHDNHFIKHSARDLINRAVKLNFNVLAITCHNYVYFNQEMKDYAQQQGILLLSGAELDLEGKHTLVYNISNEQIKNIKTFQDLKKLKAQYPEIFVIAPHPFHYFPNCLKKNIIKHLDLFDAWEYSFFYTRYFNPNKRTQRLAKKYNKLLVGNSDIHFLDDLGKTYTLIDSIQKKEEIFEAIKKGKVRIKSRPLTTLHCLKNMFNGYLKRK